MNAYWIKFTDGTEACCEGGSEFDAQRIAEKLTGKTVADTPNSWTAGDVKPLPYPASPVIWQLDHPCHGKTPLFCYEPKQCAGRSSCPQRRGCVE
jgi:hypothetical protein